MTPYSFEGDKVSRKLAEEQLKLLVKSGFPKKAIELYVNKVNMGALQNPDVVTTYLGPCGDIIGLYLKIDKAGEIKDGKFYYLGCPCSAASASAIIELVKGKTIDEAKKITENDVLNALGGLPKTKLDCSKLAITTLQKAIVEYEKMKGCSEI